MSSTAAGLSLAGIRNQTDVSQPPVVGFRCGKVENLGGRMRRMKKRGPHVLYDLNDLLFSLHVLYCSHVALVVTVFCSYFLSVVVLSFVDCTVFAAVICE